MTAEEVVRKYLDVLYNERRLDLVAELISEPTWRHHAGECKQLTIDESLKRLEDTLELCPVLHFETSMLAHQGEMVTVCWNGNSTQKDGKSYVYCGIEVFRVVDGKITEIWNSRETGGHWLPPVTRNGG